MRARRTAALILSAALMLSGCAAATDPTWQPPAWEGTLLQTVAAPEPLDPATVPAIVPQRLRNDAVGVQARVALLPGASPLNDRVLGLVRDAVGQRAAASATDYVPQAFPRGAGMGDRACMRGSTLRPATEVLADPALGPHGGAGSAVVCDVVAAAGSVFGQRVRVVSGSGGAVTADVSTLVYTDVSSGAVATGRELWTPEAPGRLWTAAVETVRREAGALSLRPVDAPDEAALAAFAPALDATVPAPDGSLVITVPAGFTAPELAELDLAPSAEALAVAVPPSLAAGLTSPLGSALVAALASQAPYQPPAAVPAGHEPIDCGLFPCVAVTYDDGPSALTPRILDALAAHHAAATFFVLGANVRGLPEVAQRTAAEGHLVENHSWNHPHLPALDGAAVGRQIRDTSAVIQTHTGQKVTMFRPPYGEYNSAVLAAAGLPAILWDIDTKDWAGTPDDVLLTRAIDEPRPGSIVLQHDIHENTARTAAAVFEGLEDRGFRLVTVAQLFGERMPASGAWRSGR